MKHPNHAEAAPRISPPVQPLDPGDGTRRLSPPRISPVPAEVEQPTECPVEHVSTGIPTPPLAYDIRRWAHRLITPAMFLYFAAVAAYGVVDMLGLSRSPFLGTLLLAAAVGVPVAMGLVALRAWRLARLWPAAHARSTLEVLKKDPSTRIRAVSAFALWGLARTGNEPVPADTPDGVGHEVSSAEPGKALES